MARRGERLGLNRNQLWISRVRGKRLLQEHAHGCLTCFEADGLPVTFDCVGKLGGKNDALSNPFHEGAIYNLLRALAPRLAYK